MPNYTTPSLNKLKDLFQALQQSVLMLKDFDFGPAHNLKSEHQYPLLFVEPGSGQVIRSGPSGGSLKVFEQSFNLIVVDRIAKGDDNYNEVLSDCQYILLTLITYLDRSETLVDLGINTSGNVFYEPVFNRFDADLNGWQATITLRFANYFNTCNIPVLPILNFTIPQPQIQDYISFDAATVSVYPVNYTTPTLNQLRDIFYSISVANVMVHDFGFGSTYNKDSLSGMKFPLMYVEPDQGQAIRSENSSGSIKVFEQSFSIYVLDKIAKGQENFDETLSNCQYILQTIVTLIDRHPLYNALSINTNGNIDYKPVYEVTSYDCNGWVATITLRYPNRFNLCNIPVLPSLSYSDSVGVNALEYRLIGATGPQGATGPRGFQGYQGNTGLNGATGSQGTQGERGEQGVQGNYGPVGPGGLIWKGLWHSGTTYSINDSVGFSASSWFCFATVSSITPPNIDVTHWALLASQGADGVQGPQGFQGNQGPQGTQGNNGSQGPQGNQGTGLNGATGGQGNTGLTGVTGSQGYQGPQGNQGNTGATGSQGNQGNQGDNGLTGATGSQGPQGNQGDIGATGSQGNTGLIGVTGSQGPQGNQGLQGTYGPIGPAGLVWQGLWNSGTTYSTNDSVSFASASWFCFATVSSATTPNTDTSHWALLAAQGAPGPNGAQGPQGSGGIINIGALDSQTPNSTGATISSGILYLQSGSTANAGLINTTTQSFIGQKTFRSPTLFGGTVSFLNGLGSILHLLGPSDQPFVISSSSQSDINIVTPNVVGTIARSINITTGSSNAAGTGSNINITANTTSNSANASGIIRITGNGTTINNSPSGMSILLASINGGIEIRSKANGNIGSGNINIITENLPTASSGGSNATAINDTTGSGGSGVSGSGGLGGDRTITLGAGGNSTGTNLGTNPGNAGNFILTGGVGGSTNALGTHSGGTGSQLFLFSGNGGGATGSTSVGTQTGGRGGRILLKTGAAGTGTTTNGLAGVFSVGIGADNNSLLVDSTRNVIINSTNKLLLGTSVDNGTDILQANGSISAGGVVSWISGLGSINHLLGPTDQPFTIVSPSLANAAAGVNLNIASGGINGTTAPLAPAGSVNITGGAISGTNSGIGGDINITSGTNLTGVSTRRVGNINISTPTGVGGGESFGSTGVITLTSQTGVVSGGVNNGIVLSTPRGAAIVLSAASVQVTGGSQNGIQLVTLNYPVGGNNSSAPGAPIILTTGNGNQNSNIQSAGNGGLQTFTLGAGGSVPSTNTANPSNGGNGGVYSVVGGNGGAQLSAAATYSASGGRGSDINFNTGNGGAAIVVAIGQTRSGGNAGSYTFIAGNGGAGVNANGNGGGFVFQTGISGTGSGTTGIVGDYKINIGANTKFQVASTGNVIINGSNRLILGTSSDNGVDILQANGSIRTTKVNFTGATSGTLGIIANPITTTHTLTMPATQGSASTVLTNDGFGNLSWSAGIPGPTGSGGSGGTGSLAPVVMYTIPFTTNFTYSVTNGPLQQVTLTGNATMSLSGLTSGVFYVLEVTQDSTGGRTLNWTPSVTVPFGGSGSVPQTSNANATDKYTIIFTGTKYRVDFGLNYT